MILWLENILIGFQSLLRVTGVRGEMGGGPGEKGEGIKKKKPS